MWCTLRFFSIIRSLGFLVERVSLCVRFVALFLGLGRLSLAVVGRIGGRIGMPSRGDALRGM